MAEAQEDLARVTRRLPRLLLAATLSAVTYDLVVVQLARASTRGCDTGFAGIDCQISRGLSALVAGLLLSALPGALVLRASRFGHPSIVALFASLNVGLAWIFVKAFSSSPAAHIAVLIVAFTAFSALYDALFNRWRMRTWARVLIGGIVVAGTFVALSWIGLRVDSKREVSAFVHALERADFTAYSPSYAPPGYQSVRVGIVSGSSAGNRTFFQDEYYYGQNQPADPRPYTLYSFRAIRGFDPPTNCGGEYPTVSAGKPMPCSRVQTTATGKVVYFARDPLRNFAIWYVRLGDTEVTISTDNAAGMLTPDSVSRIYDSLRRVGGRRPGSLTRR